MDFKTTEDIDNNDVEIAWTFTNEREEIDDLWYDWIVRGMDNDGNHYKGYCQANFLHEINTQNITNLELVKRNKKAAIV